MEPDSLAAAFGRFHVTSPSPSEDGKKLTSSAVTVQDAPQGRLLFQFRAFLNPKDMMAQNLVAGSFVTIFGKDSTPIVTPVWPHVLLAAGRIRVSHILAEWLQVADGDQVKWSISNQTLLNLPDVLKIQVLDHVKLDTVEKDSLSLVLSDELPCLQSGLKYSIPLFVKSTPTVRLSFVLPGSISKNSSSAFSTAGLKPSKIVYIDSSTADNAEAVLERADSNSISGLDNEIDCICESIRMIVGDAAVDIKNELIRPPKGILLYGPPGTGKSSIVKVVAARMALPLFAVNGAEIASGRYYGEAESNLRNIFSQAALKSEGAILFLDELDCMCPSRDKLSSAAGSESRIVATLLTLLDGITSGASGRKLFCIAATNAPNAIDAALRRPGRFDKELEIGVPSFQQRLDILCALMVKNGAVSIASQTLSDIAAKAHGFVGADLAMIVKEANLIAFKRSNGPATFVDEDLAVAFGRTKPSATREVLLDVPSVRWEDIGGQEEVKRKLRESVESPLKHPEIFLKFGINPPKGILLYGPPGCSKTMLAKAIATESGLNFFAVKGPEIFSKWVGDSEKAIAEIFRKARLVSPSVIFFDEFDAIGKSRTDQSTSGVADRVLSQLLTEMDGIDPLTSVTILAATNRPDVIDEALMRPGRFDRHIYIPLPDQAARLEILKIGTKKMPICADVVFDELAADLTGYSGAEISGLCQEAALAAFADNLSEDQIQMRHFRIAMDVMKPRTSEEMISFFENFRVGRL